MTDSAKDVVETMLALRSGFEGSVDSHHMVAKGIARDISRQKLSAKLLEVNKLAHAVKKGEAVAFTDRNGRQSVKYTYANFSNIMDVYSPLLADNDLVLTHRVSTEHGPNERVCCEAVITSPEAPLCEITSGQVGICYWPYAEYKDNDVKQMANLAAERSKALGSAISYLKRYTTSALLCVTFSDSDDSEQVEGIVKGQEEVRKALQTLSPELREKVAKFMDCSADALDANIPKLLMNPTACARVLYLAKDANAPNLVR